MLYLSIYQDIPSNIAMKAKSLTVLVVVILSVYGRETAHIFLGDQKACIVRGNVSMVAKPMMSHWHHHACNILHPWWNILSEHVKITLMFFLPRLHLKKKNDSCAKCLAEMYPTAPGYEAKCQLTLVERLLGAKGSAPSSSFLFDSLFPPPPPPPPIPSSPLLWGPLSESVSKTDKSEGEGRSRNSPIALSMWTVQPEGLNTENCVCTCMY